MNSNKWMHYCRVCGLDQEEPIWDVDNKSPSYFICSCCGTEFGIEDRTLTLIKEQRAKWLKHPEQWFSPKEKPANWNLMEQIKNIPSQYL